jgi:hypothetical protein
VITCPIARSKPDGAPRTIIGCGSTNVVGPDDEGLYDCLDCGIFFDPHQERNWADEEELTKPTNQEGDNNHVH